MEPIKIVACAPPHCKCPELIIEDQVVIIRDDFNGEVNMTLEQWLIMTTEFMKKMADMIGSDGEIPKTGE